MIAAARPPREWFQGWERGRFLSGLCRTCANDRAPHSTRCADCLRKCKDYRQRKKAAAAA